ncbi:hypothetical protein ACFODO_03135 [Acinetobacter sichuanensis]|uniref:Uncharacterized protein n=1 Tax=Acinetobacter sichuanensis TaxID=2136183 RepID=A0A371YT12_9GAMM|nr:hypothetical protein [Acinetobacter sichuanensis]RFC84608.1 hypothetical protein C9E89_005000 [Acinetobacter sichuanensis]
MKKLLIISMLLLPMLAQAQPFKYQKTGSDFKHYQGQVALTGTYFRELDPEYVDYLGDNICFTPDKKSASLIPRPKGDERSAYFCFHNFEQARKTFKLPDSIKKGYCTYEGKATITIKNYDLFFIESEGFDYTTLISAKNVTPVKTVKCKTYE